MQREGWPKTIGIGLLIGLVASIFMTLAMMALRYGLGIATPAELVGDRLAPTFTIQEFFELLSRYGGYNELKQVGVTSVLAGQLSGWGARRCAVRLDRPAAAHTLVTIREATPATAMACCSSHYSSGVLWLVTLLALWSVLGTHYGGLPPGSARVATGLGLLVSYAIYGLTLVWAHRTLIGPRTDRTTVPAAPRIGRRAALVGGLGAVAAILTGWPHAASL